MVAAANPPGVAADGWDLSPPLANRFCHIPWKLPAGTVRDGFTLGWDPVSAPVIDPERLALSERQARVAVGTFLGARPELVTRLPSTLPGDDEHLVSGFPTPRSWEMAAKLHAAATVSGAGPETWAILVSGVVGPGPAAELRVYLTDLGLPDPEVVLADPDGYRIPSHRTDKVHAVAAAVCTAALDRPSAGRWLACGRLLARLAEAGHADVAVLSGRRWMAARPEGVLPDRTVIRSLGPILGHLEG